MDRFVKRTLLGDWACIYVGGKYAVNAGWGKTPEAASADLNRRIRIFVRDFPQQVGLDAPRNG